MITITKIYNSILSIFFYPFFILPYILYSVAFRLACLVQYLFTEIYIQQICGFKDKQKIIDSINSLEKVPEDVVLAFNIDKFLIENEQRFNQNKEIERKIIEEYLHIIINLHAVKTITLFLTSESSAIEKIISRIQNQINSLQTNKKISIIDCKQKEAEQVQKLTNESKKNTPFMLVFSNYESTCGIPSKYLVNAEIAFSPEIFSASNYGIYKSFCQYSSSKQRNGK